MTAGTIVTPLTASAEEDATVIKQFGCMLLAADWQGPVDPFTDDVTHFVEAASGNWVLQCRFDIPDGVAPTKAVKTEGFLCSSFVGVTTDRQSIATPGGKAHLRCRVVGNG